jgi:hypothetical protein
LKYVCKNTLWKWRKWRKIKRKENVEQVKLRHKWFLNFHGTAFGCWLRSFNIFMVMIPHHTIKGT